MEVWVTVMDYTVSGVRVYHITDIPTDSKGYPDFDAETWLYNNDPGYKEDTCYYMYSLENPEIEHKEAKYEEI